MTPSLSDARNAIATGDGHGILIAVLDTGIDQSHPDFADCRFETPMRISREDAAFHAEPTPPDDPGGHGTAIAGIIHRLAPEASIVSIRVLDASLRQHRHEVIRQGALTGLELGARILNCSLGIPGSNYTLPLYKSWTDAAFLQNRHVVTASSNEHVNAPEWPSHLATTHAVTQGRQEPGEWAFRAGQPIPFQASGVNIRVPTPGGGHATLTGSSFAAAAFTGLLARLLGNFPGTTPSLARELFRQLATD